jgi:hypothetical protein
MRPLTAVFPYVGHDPAGSIGLAVAEKSRKTKNEQFLSYNEKTEVEGGVIFNSSL